MGWVLALEGIAVYGGAHAYNKSREAHGDHCSSFLKVHSQEDPDHLASAFKQCELLSTDDQSLVIKGFELYLALYNQTLEGIVKKANFNINQNKNAA